MSKENVIKIIKKASNDEIFSKKLFDNCDEAIKGYSLTDGEIALLKGIKRESYSQFTFDLEQRINKDDDWWVGSIQD